MTISPVLSAWLKSLLQICWRKLRRASKSDLSNLIYALGLRHVGDRTATTLREQFGSLEALSKATVEELDDVPEIGLTVAQSVRDWFDDPGNIELCKRLEAGGRAHEN